jgi:cysteine desulfurase
MFCRQAEASAPARMAALRDQLEAAVLGRIPGARPTVGEAPRAPHLASVTIPDLPAEPILHALEARGVIASAGSACASRSRGPNHVLAAIGVDEGAAVLRFSLSRYTTSAEVEQAAQALGEAVAEIAVVAGGRRRGGKAR